MSTVRQSSELSTYDKIEQLEVALEGCIRFRNMHANDLRSARSLLREARRLLAKQAGDFAADDLCEEIGLFLETT